MMTGTLIGDVHLYAALLATLLGTQILMAAKGTKSHRRIGMTYAISMLIVNVTAFMIYRLYGQFGIFHIAAIVSLVTLLLGLLPLLINRSKRNLIWHICYMYWSVIGLYAAFVAETLTRVPEQPFYGMLALACFLTFAAGSWGFRTYKNRWISTFTK